MNELEIGRAVATGELASPQDIGGSWLFAIRITGTGLARRADERVWRDPVEWTKPETLARCNGLSVIWEHPPGLTLDSAEFADRAIGAIMLPYLAGRDGKQRDDGNEVWGIVRVFDAQAARLMATEPCSTSPCVTFSRDDGNVNVRDLLIEGRPSRLDHVAICAAGVWDKGDAPSGVRVDHTTLIMESKMSDTTEKSGDEGDVMSRILAMLEGMDSRLSKLEGGSEEAEADRARKADKAKKADAETQEKKGDEPWEERDGVKADSAYSSRIAQHRVKADEVAAAWGVATTKPFFGESINAYRRRCLRSFQQHSADFAGVDLARVPHELLDVAERTIYADALKAAFSPASAGAGRLREIKKTDPTGRVVSEFVGDVSAWLNDFKGPVQYVTRIRTNFN